jgi:hypothetical protein
MYTEIMIRNRLNRTNQFDGTARLLAVLIVFSFAGIFSGISWAGAPPCLPGLPCESATPPSVPPSSGPNSDRE